MSEEKPAKKNPGLHGFFRARRGHYNRLPTGQKYFEGMTYTPFQGVTWVLAHLKCSMRLQKDLKRRHVSGDPLSIRYTVLRSRFHVFVYAAAHSMSVQREATRIVDLLPPDLVAQLTKRVLECTDKLRQVLSREDEYFIEDVEKGVLTFKRCVCRELAILLELNGRLPEGTFEEWWTLYKCRNTRRRTKADKE